MPWDGTIWRNTPLSLKGLRVVCPRPRTHVYVNHVPMPRARRHAHSHVVVLKYAHQQGKHPNRPPPVQVTNEPWARDEAIFDREITPRGLPGDVFDDQL